MVRRAEVLLCALVACGGGGSGADAPPADAPAAHSLGVVVAGGGSSEGGSAGDVGVLAAVDTGPLTLTSAHAPMGAIGADPIVRHVGHELLVVNRGVNESNVTILDDATFAQVAQLGVPAGSRPSDVAVVGDELYVPLAAGAGVARLPRGGGAMSVIDLSASDPDGKPNCVSAFAVGTDVYVTCQLLDDTQPTPSPRGPGAVVVIDTTTHAVRATLALSTANPTSLIEPMDASTLAVATVDASGAGCVEKIITGASPVAAGCIARNALFGGHVTRLAVQALVDNSFLWMVVDGPGDSSGASSGHTLEAYDLANSSLWPPLSDPSEAISDLALCPDGSLVLADVAAGASGLRVYQLAAEVTKHPLDVGQVPRALHGLVCY